jgi:hypothetical protein
MRLVATILIAVLAAVGCNALPGASPSISAPTLPTDLTIPPSMSLPPELGEVPVELFLDAAEQAAAIAAVPVDQVSLVRAAAVTWNDGSLGCPEPGQMYTQALVPGFWLVLVAGGNEFDFRASERGEVKLCPAGQGIPPVEDS